MLRLLLCLTLLVSLAKAQFAAPPKLQKLYDAGKYDKCIDKATKMGKDKEDGKNPYVQLYIMLSWMQIADQPDHESYKSALNKALNAAVRVVKKDKDKSVVSEYSEDFDKLKKMAYDKAADFEKAGKCPRAIAIYDDIQTVYADRLSNYKKSLCQLQTDGLQEDGFKLLRTTVLQTLKDHRTGMQSELKIPEGFARLARLYWQKQYFYNAEDIVRQGLDIYPKNDSLRTEMMVQVEKDYASYYPSDAEKDLLKLRSKLLWADSSFRQDNEISSLLLSANHKLIGYYIKYEYDSLQKTLDFINKARLTDTTLYAMDSINLYLVSLYRQNEVRRIEGALTNLTNVLVRLNMLQTKEKTEQSGARYVFDFLLAHNDYDVAAYFIKQSKTLYVKDKKALDAMQVALENKLVEILAAAPKQAESLELARKFGDIAPANKKLKELEKNLYYTVLKQMSDSLDFGHFFTTVRAGLKRFPDDATMRRLDKEMVIKDFKANFTPNLIEDFKELKVVYHIPTCTAGKVDSLANKKFMRLFNYLRRQAGLYDTCMLDAELNELAQQAALMMKANDDLNHAPPKTWKCYSDAGKRGAGSSNLSLGTFATEALLGQLEDDGEGNYSVGHRRWVLNPYNWVYGHGSTDNSMALAVFGKVYKDPAKNKTLKWDANEFISWPQPDYSPAALLPGRWSFSLDNANFEKAKISVTLKGKPVKAYMEQLSQGYGINTVVWHFSENIVMDSDYTVAISNIFINGQEKPKTYTYKVNVVSSLDN